MHNFNNLWKSFWGLIQTWPTDASLLWSSTLSIQCLLLFINKTETCDSNSLYMNIPSFLRCSSGFDRNRQDWVDLGCPEEVLVLLSFQETSYSLIEIELFNISHFCLPAQKDWSGCFLFPETGSTVSPHNGRRKRHIWPPDAYDHSCYSDRSAAEDVRRDLRPPWQDVRRHRPLNTQQR